MVFTHTKSTHLQRWLCAVVLMITALFSWSAWAQDQAIPKLDNWVVDTTGTFSAAQNKALSDRLQAFEKSKGAQIFVLMVPTIGNEVIEQYTRRVYDQWQVGRKKIDDGVLLVVAKDDRRLRIEVGYGLEGAITDLQAGRIIREFITPYFAQNDYVGGINQGVDKLMSLVEGEELPPPAQSDSDVPEEFPVAFLLPLIFFSWVLPPLAAVLATAIFSFFIFFSVPIAIFCAFIALIISIVGKVFGGSRGSSVGASRKGTTLGGFGSSGRGGGGFGGGGFGGGGFGGGGGGSSGGGGASGSW